LQFIGQRPKLTRKQYREKRGGKSQQADYQGNSPFYFYADFEGFHKCL
jgi:hypothetical protein